MSDEDSERPGVTLPPGQRAVEGFPRFGTHMDRPPPEVPSEPAIEITGAVTEPFAVPLAKLASLPRRGLTADLHCVAGWSATGLHWEGVAFETFYRAIVEPALQPDATVTHLIFGGLDGFWSTATIEDALTADVLIAERLDGRPLDGDHGAPARLVSPHQYGFINTKHLCRLEVLTAAPAEGYGSATAVARVALRALGYRAPSRARVWKEERHPFLPAWSIRLVSRVLIPPIAYLSARGRRSERTPIAPP